MHKNFENTFIFRVDIEKNLKQNKNALITKNQYKNQYIFQRKNKSLMLNYFSERKQKITST